MKFFYAMLFLSLFKIFFVLSKAVEKVIPAALPIEGSDQDKLTSMWYPFHHIRNKTDVTFQKCGEARLELIWVQDTTYSFERFLKKTKTEFEKFIIELQKPYSGTKIALAQFTDRRVNPHGMSNEVCYRLLTSFTTDSTLLNKQFNALKATGGYDYPEDGASAMYVSALQFSAMPEQNPQTVQSPVVRIMVLVTDALGKVAGAEPPVEDVLSRPFRGVNLDTMCSSEKFPALSQLKDIFQEKKIIPLVFTTKGKKEYWNNLLYSLNVGGVVETLQEGEKMIEAVQRAIGESVCDYKHVHQYVSLSDNYRPTQYLPRSETAGKILASTLNSSGLPNPAPETAVESRVIDDIVEPSIYDYDIPIETSPVEPPVTSTSTKLVVQNTRVRNNGLHGEEHPVAAGGSDSKNRRDSAAKPTFVWGLEVSNVEPERIDRKSEKKLRDHQQSQEQETKKPKSTSKNSANGALEKPKNVVEPLGLGKHTGKSQVEINDDFNTASHDQSEGVSEDTIGLELVPSAGEFASKPGSSDPETSRIGTSLLATDYAVEKHVVNSKDTKITHPELLSGAKNSVGKHSVASGGASEQHHIKPLTGSSGTANKDLRTQSNHETFGKNNDESFTETQTQSFQKHPDTSMESEDAVDLHSEHSQKKQVVKDTLPTTNTEATERPPAAVLKTVNSNFVKTEQLDLLGRPAQGDNEKLTENVEAKTQAKTTPRTTPKETVDTNAEKTRMTAVPETTDPRTAIKEATTTTTLTNKETKSLEHTTPLPETPKVATNTTSTQPSKDETTTSTTAPRRSVAAAVAGATAGGLGGLAAAGSAAYYFSGSSAAASLPAASAPATSTVEVVDLTQEIFDREVIAPSQLTNFV